MKKIKFIGFVILGAVILIYACKKKDTQNTENNSLTVTSASISAKWIVTGSSASTFTSFEFNKTGSYIVAMPNSNKFGSYTISGSKVTLNGFGTIEFTKLQASQCEFKITTSVKSTLATYTVTATKAPEFPSTGRTALLCKTWSLLTLDSIPVAGTSMELDVMFTEAGTYFVHYVQIDTSLMSHWQWKDDTKQILCYNWFGTPTCTGDNEVVINEVTTTKLIMTEDAFKYVLVPLVTKSTVTFDNQTVPKNSRSFFGIRNTAFGKHRN